VPTVLPTAAVSETAAKNQGFRGVGQQHPQQSAGAR
jgi:hypothetical protein